MESHYQSLLVEAINIRSRGMAKAIKNDNERKPPSKNRKQLFAWLANLIKQGYTPGMADVTVYWMDDDVSRFAMIEVKKPKDMYGPKGYLNKNQKAFREEAGRRKWPYLVWDNGNVEFALEWIKGLGAPIKRGS